MKQKSEKQLAAKVLYNQIIKPNISEVKIYYEFSRYNGETASTSDTFYLFILNNEKYIGRNCLIGDVCNFIKQKESAGEIKSFDSIHAHIKTSAGSRVAVFYKTDVLLRYREELEKYVKRGNFGNFNIERTGRMFQAINSSEPICENNIEQSVLDASETAYARRVELINEASKERHAEIRREEQEEKELEKLRLTYTMEEDTLKDLVAKIEAMGWEVTLKLKQ